MTSDSVITAIGFIVDEHFGHESTSIPRLCFISVAQSMYEVLRRPRNLSRVLREVTSLIVPELPTIAAAACDVAASVLGGVITNDGDERSRGAGVDARAGAADGKGSGFAPACTEFAARDC